jgi:hypothetical protein
MSLRASRLGVGMIPRSLGLLLDAIVGQAVDDEARLLTRQYLFFWKATQSFPSLP